MKRTLVCLNKSINLADKCKEKTTLLVYETSGKSAKRKDDCVPRPKISIVPTKTIKICTGAEFKKMCRPPPCDCPPIPSKFGTIVIFLYRTALFGIKSAILGGLLYWTWEAGIWGDSEDTEMFYSSVCHLFTNCPKQTKVLSKACKKELEIRDMLVGPNTQDDCLQPPVNNAKMAYQIKQYWNHTVTAMFQAVTEFPDNVKRYYEELTKDDKKCVKVKEG